MSYHGMSEDEVEVQSQSETKSDYALEADVNVEVERGDRETQTTSSMTSATTNMNFPSTIVEDFAKGPFDPKSPLKQFATKLQSRLGTSRGTKLWKCHFCGLEFQGSVTKINAHLLHI